MNRKKFSRIRTQLLWSLGNLLCFSLTSLAAFAAPVLPLDHFTKEGDYLDLKFSPDAKHLLARVRRDDRIAAVVIRRSDNEIVGGVQSAANDVILSIDWATNERLLYTVAEKWVWNASDSPNSTGELYAINIDGSNHEIIFGIRNSTGKSSIRNSRNNNNQEKSSHEILSMLEDDPRNILILERPWEKVGHYYMERGNEKPIVSKLNIHNGYREQVEILPHPGAYALASKAGDVHFMAWQTANNKLHAAYRPDHDAPWQELSYAGQGLRDIWPVQISHNSDTAYLSASTGARGVRKLHAMTLRTGQLKPAFPDHQTDIESYFEDPITGMPTVMTTWPAGPEYHYSATPTTASAAHQQLVRAFPGQHVAIADSTKDGTLLLVRVSSPINPGEYYLFNTQSKKADFLFANASWIDPRELQPVTTIRLTAKDGTELRGYLTHANPAVAGADKPAPLIVLPHGGPHGVRDYGEFDPEVQLFANRGYAVLQLNFRGSGGYGATFEAAGHRQWGGKMIDDLIDAIGWAISSGHADPDRVCSYGASYGGYAALMLAAKAPTLIKCAVGYAGIYDLELMHSTGDIPELSFGGAFLDKVIGNDPAEHRRFSPSHQASQIQAPVLLIHGAKDRRAPMAHAKAMRKALKKAGNPPEWLSFKTSGHGVGNETNREKLYNRTLVFLEQHLKSQ